MRRRAKPKVVWLPNTNANSIGAGVRTTTQTFIVAAAGAPGDSALGEIPIVIDTPGDPIGAADITLSDIFSSAYRLRRIVGKIWVGANQTQQDTPQVVQVTAGLIIRRTDPTTGVSMAFETGDATQMDPMDIENSSDPWIWRRAWLLRNILATGATHINEMVGTPTNNMSPGYGSAVDGPHVDVKTARIVGPEERLFLDVSSTVLIQGDDVQAGPALNVRVFADLRVLASLRSSTGNRRNASR